MRVVAGDAANAAVFCVITLGIGEAIGLKTNIANAAWSICGYVGPGAVAAPARFALFLGTPARKFRHCLWFGGAFEGLAVGHAAAMAVITTHSGLHVCEIHAPGTNRIGGVTGKASCLVFQAHFPAGCLDQSLRRGRRRAHRQIERSRFLVKAQTALKPLALVLVDISLSSGTMPEGIYERNTQTLHAIAHRVNGFLAAPLNTVEEIAQPEFQLGDPVEKFVFAGVINLSRPCISG